MLNNKWREAPPPTVRRMALQFESGLGVVMGRRHTCLQIETFKKKGRNAPFGGKKKKGLNTLLSTERFPYRRCGSSKPFCPERARTRARRQAQAPRRLWVPPART